MFRRILKFPASLLLMAAAAPAQTPAGLASLPIPVRPANKPQTEQQAAEGQARGRALPIPEILQPALDQSLPGYRPVTGAKLSGKFTGAASDVLPGLAKAWIERFRTYYPDVEINVAPPYAGSLGAVELVKGNIDLVFVSRELRPDDIAGFRQKFGYPPLSVPVSGGSYRHFGFLDAVGVFVNKANPLDKLSVDQLDAVLSATRHRGGAAITTWGQLGLTGEWADKPIQIYGIQPWNGFEEFVRQRILSVDGKRGEWREGIHFDKLVFPVAGRVAQDRYGIGYSGLAYLDAEVKLLALGQTREGPFAPPTYEAVARAEYPLSRLIYLNVNRAPGKPLPPALAEFLRFVLSREGQQIVRDQAIYMPLRSEQAARSLALTVGPALPPGDAGPFSR